MIDRIVEMLIYPKGPARRWGYAAVDKKTTVKKTVKNHHSTVAQRRRYHHVVPWPFLVSLSVVSSAPTLSSFYDSSRTQNYTSFVHCTIKLIRTQVRNEGRGDVAHTAKSHSHVADLSCAQSTESDGNMQPRVPASGARHEDARVSADFTEGLLFLLFCFVFPDGKRGGRGVFCLWMIKVGIVYCSVFVVGEYVVR